MERTGNLFTSTGDEGNMGKADVQLDEPAFDFFMAFLASHALPDQPPPAPDGLRQIRL